MSIASEISRIQQNVTDSLTAVANKGVTVPAGSTSDDLPDLISQITGGGGGGDTYTRTVVIPQQTVSGNRTPALTHTGALVDGEYYIVTLDGTEYTCTGRAQWSNAAVTIGDLNFYYSVPNEYDYPFAVGYETGTDATDCALLDTNSHTIKVEHLEFVDGPLNLIDKSITVNGTYDAEDDNADGYSSVTVNVSGGGGSSFSLLYSSEVNVTTSSTTNTAVTSLSTGVTFDTTKVYMVSVRDKAGKRNGYYFGTDTYFLPITATNTTVAVFMTFYVDSNGEVKWTQTAYGVFLYRYYRGNNMGQIDINSRYNSSYGTIDGTFTIKLYEVAIPNALT